MSTSQTHDPTTHKWHMHMAVHTLKNCHEYDPVHEIMALAKHFTEWLRMNASGNSI
jgi:hypothetical protein